MMYDDGMSAAPKLEPPARGRMTFAEYATLCEKSDRKYEFHAGRVVAMAGGTENHSRCSRNLTSSLHNRVRPPCESFESNLRVHVRQTARGYYPDAFVVCGDVEFDDRGPAESTVLNPRVVFEVLSPSTERFDRTEKFDHYRRIESFEEYVLISQDEPRVETFLRQDNGNWLMSIWTGTDAVARVRCLELDLPLAELYAGVVFPLREAEPDAAAGQP